MPISYYQTSSKQSRSTSRRAHISHLSTSPPLHPCKGNTENVFLYRNSFRLSSLRTTSGRLLSDVKIEDVDSLGKAIQALHERYGIPHVVITSVSLKHAGQPDASLSVVGSTRTSDHRARPFKIVFPAFDCQFSGTGDMFAALMVVRMREAAGGAGLTTRESWLSGDEVGALDLPLAKATEMVLASMHEVLEKTSLGMAAEVERAKAAALATAGGLEEDGKTMHLIETRAAELNLVRNLESLRSPNVCFPATEL